MKAVLVALVFCFVYIPEAETQILKDIKRVFRQTSSLSEKDAADGIREALIKGTDSGVDLVSVTDGYFGNPEIKIPFPQEAKDIESTLRSAAWEKKWMKLSFPSTGLLNLLRAKQLPYLSLPSKACPSAMPLAL